ncbi:MAG: FkbM family methyltransferase [Cryomorphaceae bacterium]|nr:FkbM family methyltransferase [Cryomorphaceae bacterium]
MNFRNFLRKYSDPVVSVNEVNLEQALHDWVPDTPGYVVQIGSYDGKTHDPLHRIVLSRHNWAVVLVEPVPQIFQRLKRNYPTEDRFHFEQVAINDGKSAPFYYVDESELHKSGIFPDWAGMLSSFDRNHILKHLDGALAPFIRTVELPGMTLPDVFKKHNVNTLHLLHIDAEGYDWRILKQLNLRKYQPAVILFEYAHLAPNEIESAKRFLAPKYEIHVVEMDFLCRRRK